MHNQVTIWGIQFNFFIKIIENLDYNFIIN
jgi:hypothetical protein